MDTQDSISHVSRSQPKKSIDQDIMAWAETMVILVSEMGLSLSETLDLTVQQIEVLFEGWQRLQKRKERECQKASRKIK